MSLSNEQCLGEIAALRIKIKTNTELRNDLIGAIENIFSKHGIILEADLRSSLTIALADELDGKTLGSGVVLPGGTNC